MMIESSLIKKYINLFTLYIVFLFSFQVQAVSDLYVCTASCRNYFDKVLNLIASIHKVNYSELKEIAVFDLGLEQSQIDQLKSIEKVSVYKLEQNNPDVLKRFKVGPTQSTVLGWYAWKVVAIKQALDMFPHVLWLDGGTTVLNSLNDLNEHLVEHGHFLATIGDETKKDGSWMHPVKWGLTNFVRKAFNLDAEANKWILDKEMIMGGVIGMVRDSEAYKKILMPLYGFAQEKGLRYFQDDGTAPDGWGKARHDQVLLSCLVYSQGFNFAIQDHKQKNPIHFTIGNRTVDFHITWNDAYVDQNTNIYSSRGDIKRYDLFSKFTKYKQGYDVNGQLPNSKAVPHLLIKIPTRSRPQRFFEVLDKYYEMLSGDVPYSFLITCDEDDSTMNNSMVIERLRQYPNLHFFFGKSKSKIDSYNRDFDKNLKFNILCIGSDDLEPIEPAFDLIIVEEMMSRFPDFDGVVRFSDGLNYSNANIYPVIGKKYFDRFGFVYYPEYKTAYCDNELTDVARRLHKNHDANIVLMRHNHPGFGRAPMDDLYIRNENKQLYKHDAGLYQMRKERDFPMGDYWTERLQKRMAAPDEKEWNILICTLDERKITFERIYNKLKKQIADAHLEDKIEILFERDNREKTVGLKRNILLERSVGKYISFVDDDDDVHEQFIAMVHKKLQENADCVSLIGEITFDGKNKKIFKHSIKYDHYFEEGNVYYRPPNHLNPIKRNIALQASFTDKYYGEDTDWAMSLSKRGLINTEAVIDIPYYYYLYKPHK